MMRRVLLALVAGIVVAVLLEMITATPRSTIDFTAFYCAGRVIRDHGDPYRAQPLGACEASVASEGIYGVRGVVMPAPLPPYALMPFAALASLPYERALVVWRLLLLAAVVVAVAALRRVTGLPWFTVLLALLSIDGMANVLPGQPVPIVVAAVAVGAWALERGADRVAGAVACLTMLEPHVGLPVCLALLLCRPAARVSIACGTIIAATLSLAILPMSTSVEYITSVLPRHAASEIPWYSQYSLTHALYVLGVSDRLSLTAGSLSYLVMLVFALVLAPRVASRLGAPSLLIALPAGVVLLGGAFIHISQIAAAVPAALILTGRTRGVISYLGATACVLLTVLGLVLGNLVVVCITACVAAVLAVSLFLPPCTAGVVATATIVALGFALHGMQPIQTDAGRGLARAPVGASALAEDSWSRFVRAEDPGIPEHRLELLAAMPTWAGLGLLMVASTLVASRDQRYGEHVLLESGHW